MSDNYHGGQITKIITVGVNILFPKVKKERDSYPQGKTVCPGVTS